MRVWNFIPEDVGREIKQVMTDHNLNPNDGWYVVGAFMIWTVREIVKLRNR